MTALQAIILGFIQGFTEFLPVSSSGHLAIVQSLFEDFEQPGLLLDTLLHVATLLAVLVYFRKRIANLILGFFGFFTSRYTVQRYEQKSMIFGIVVATIPTAIIGFLLKDHVETLFTKPAIIGYLLIVTSTMLYFSDKFKGRNKISLPVALFIGIMQGFAVFPGISRSGTTIFAGLLAGLTRKEAAEFSFLISIPAILGAVVLQLEHLDSVAAGDLVIYGLSMLVAFIVGILAIHIMMKLVERAKLSFFAMYCLIVGIMVIIWM